MDAEAVWALKAPADAVLHAAADDTRLSPLRAPNSEWCLLQDRSGENDARPSARATVVSLDGTKIDAVVLRGNWNDVGEAAVKAARNALVSEGGTSLNTGFTVWHTERGSIVKGDPGGARSGNRAELVARTLVHRCAVAAGLNSPPEWAMMARPYHHGQVALMEFVLEAEAAIVELVTEVASRGASASRRAGAAAPRERLWASNRETGGVAQFTARLATHDAREALRLKLEMALHPVATVEWFRAGAEGPGEADAVAGSPRGGQTVCVVVEASHQPHPWLRKLLRVLQSTLHWVFAASRAATPEEALTFLKTSVLPVLGFSERPPFAREAILRCAKLGAEVCAAVAAPAAAASGFVRQFVEAFFENLVVVGLDEVTATHNVYYDRIMCAHEHLNAARRTLAREVELLTRIFGGLESAETERSP